MRNETTQAERGQPRAAERSQRVARLALVAACTVLVLQLARVFFPIVFDLGERSGATAEAIRAGALALAISLTPFLAPLFPRMDQEHVLVDEVAPHQRLDELSAAEHHDVLARLLFEPGHGLRGVALEERGVAPRKRLLQRRRRDVLLGVVEHRRERVGLRLVGPEGEEVLVGPSPEQEGAAIGPSPLPSRGP